jgi:hypothetical protein
VAALIAAVTASVRLSVDETALEHALTTIEAESSSQGNPTSAGDAQDPITAPAPSVLPGEIFILKVKVGGSSQPLADGSVVESDPEPVATLTFRAVPICQGEETVAGQDVINSAREMEGADAGLRHAQILAAHQDQIPSSLAQSFLACTASIVRDKESNLYVAGVKKGEGLRLGQVRFAWHSSDRVLKVVA